MSTQYFRVTAYHPAEDLSVIIDSYGKYLELWEISYPLILNGFENTVTLSYGENIIDGNITRIESSSDKVFLRSSAFGRPQNTTFEQNGAIYHAIRVGDKVYIPDRTKIAAIADATTPKKTFNLATLQRLKSQHQDKIMLVHLGDFYEAIGRDAITVSQELELVLASRQIDGHDKRLPMTGFPCSAAEQYIARLVQKGYRTAIVEI
jgi:hypothetical protein